MDWGKIFGVGGGILGGLGGSMIGMPELGAMAGSMVGGGVGGALNGDGGDDQAQQQMQERLKLYQQLMGGMPNYQGPAGLGQIQDQQKANLADLQGLSQTGLSPQDKAAFWQAQQNASGFARGQMGSIEQKQAMLGGGPGSALSPVLQAESAQGAANRLAGTDAQQAAEAAQRRAGYMQAYGGALGSYRNQEAQNADAINKFNQQNWQNQAQAAGGMAGAQANAQNYYTGKGVQNAYGNAWGQDTGAAMGWNLGKMMQNRRNQQGGGNAGQDTGVSTDENKALGGGYP